MDLIIQSRRTRRTYLTSSEKVEFAQKSPMAEDAKMSILLPFISCDSRPYLLNQYQLNRDKGDKTFNKMISSLIILSNDFTNHTGAKDKEKLLSFTEHERKRYWNLFSIR